ncbi:MAG: hypothetical protein JWN20_537 [Jatrophihabitantaceae bacterium]|nr:hypothetical protein [Jatrophihabitantaceae bacterium]
MTANPGELAPPFTFVEYTARHSNVIDPLAPLPSSVPLQRLGPDEQEIARGLAILGDSWRILNEIPVSDRGSDIDQVAIGLGGVFAIHTRGVPDADAWLVGDAIKVNRYTQSHVRSVRQNAKRAAKLLSNAAGFAVEVRGVIAVLGTLQPATVKVGPRGGAVHVVPRSQIAGFLRGQASALDLATADRIYEVARHLSTWQPGNLRKDDFWSGR